MAIAMLHRASKLLETSVLVGSDVLLSRAEKCMIKVALTNFDKCSATSEILDLIY